MGTKALQIGINLALPRPFQNLLGPGKKGPFKPQLPLGIMPNGPKGTFPSSGKILVGFYPSNPRNKEPSGPKRKVGNFPSLQSKNWEFN